MALNGIQTQAESGEEFKYILDSSKITFKIKDSNYKLAVSSFEINEGMSTCFEARISLVSLDLIRIGEVMKKPGVLWIYGSPEPRYFHGRISRFQYAGMNGKYHTYDASLAPEFWFFLMNENCRIFHNMKLIDIAKKVLRENGITSDNYEFRALDKRFDNEENIIEYCVQYHENDLAFVSRILGEEGIYYFFEHSKDKSKLIFADDNRAFNSIGPKTANSGITAINFQGKSGMHTTEESLHKFTAEGNLYAGTIIQSGHNFKEVESSLAGVQAQARTETNREYKRVFYPNTFGKYYDGERLSRIRQQAEQVLRLTFEGAGNSPRMASGSLFTLGNMTNLEIKEFLITSAFHEGSQSHVLGEQSGIGGDFKYSNSFKAIPLKTPYRARMTYDKPYIGGVQTATVIGEGEIDTDNFGQVKVRFHWDLEGKDNENIRRVRVGQAWAGGARGVAAVPRVGDEVMIQFIEGDPDWPIIVGSLFNGRNMPLYNMPENQTRTIIKTKSTPNSTGYNELRFEDKAGSEEVYLQGEKDWNILIKNDKGQTVGHDETLSVANNRTKSVGVNQSESIGSNKTIQVGVDHDENIGANMKLNVGATKKETVGIDSKENVGAAKFLSVGGLYQVSVGGIMNETVFADKSEEVFGLKAVVVGLSMQEYVKVDRKSTVDGNFDESVKKKHSLSADEYILEANKITLKSGNSTIVMDGTSITITAAKVFSN
jgi:type VI secretion system secreted protein VgrG